MKKIRKKILEKFEEKFPSLSVVDGVTASGGIVEHSPKPDIKDFISQALDNQRQAIVKELSQEVVKVIMGSKATWFVSPGQYVDKMDISVDEALFELKAEITTNVELYFYKLLSQLKKMKDECSN